MVMKMGSGVSEWGLTVIIRRREPVKGCPGGSTKSFIVHSFLNDAIHQC